MKAAFVGECNGFLISFRIKLLMSNANEWNWCTIDVTGWLFNDIVYKSMLIYVYVDTLNSVEMQLVFWLFTDIILTYLF